MGGKIDVSIIIPVYNVEEYVGECLESVMEQEADCRMECIVVDDCGSDGSMQIVNKDISRYVGPIEFHIVVREMNGGLSAARNSGIRKAKGEYVYFLDSDDLITSDCIGELFRMAKAHPLAQMVVGDFQTFPQNDVHSWMALHGKSYPEFSDDECWLRSIFLSKFPVMSWNRLIRRDFILKHNLFFKEGVIHEDNHWQARAYHHIHALAFVDNVTYLYRMREGSITSNPNAAARRLDNLCAIYSEIFQMHVKWDKPWADWIVNSLKEFKFSPIYKDIRQQSMEDFRLLTKAVWNNRTAPMPMRLLFAYWGQRPHRGQDRFFLSLYHRYWRLRHYLDK